MISTSIASPHWVLYCENPSDPGTLDYKAQSTRWDYIYHQAAFFKRLKPFKRYFIRYHLGAVLPDQISITLAHLEILALPLDLPEVEQ